jgi:hypothetical protein
LGVGSAYFKQRLSERKRVAESSALEIQVKRREWRAYEQSLSSLPAWLRQDQRAPAEDFRHPPGAAARAPSLPSMPWVSASAVVSVATGIGTPAMEAEAAVLAGPAVEAPAAGADRNAFMLELAYHPKQSHGSCFDCFTLLCPRTLTEA